MNDPMMLAILDGEGRPRRLVTLRQEWPAVIHRLLIDESDWVALIQRRDRHACPLPSLRDVTLTRAVARTLRPLDMKLADHVIHAGETRFSFRAAGLL